MALLFERPLILLIESDDDTRAAIRDVLTVERYRVLEAPSTDRALEWLRAASDGTDTPHLILLDGMAPPMGGIEFRRCLRHSPSWSRVPVVVMVLHPGLRLALVREEPMLPLLRKPFDIDELLEVVHRHCLPLTRASAGTGAPSPPSLGPTSAPNPDSDENAAHPTPTPAPTPETAPHPPAAVPAPSPDPPPATPKSASALTAQPTEEKR